MKPTLQSPSSRMPSTIMRSLVWICSPLRTAASAWMASRRQASISSTVCSATAAALAPALLQTTTPCARAASMSMALKATPSEWMSLSLGMPAMSCALTGLMASAMMKSASAAWARI